MSRSVRDGFEWCGIGDCTAPIINGVSLCHHIQEDVMEAVPTPKLFAGIRLNRVIIDDFEKKTAIEDVKDSIVVLKMKKALEKPKPKPHRERSAPVRNPAFREHEGLKALQRELNRGGRR